MAYEPLHHKYRPQTFAELVGQEAIATTLTHALRQQKIAPAYLFTGARGTGKTSSARILAKSLNCLASDAPTETPCGVCEVCRSIANGSALDVIEIDAASNTGVDNIRELIERAQFAPVQCRYKVYVIDECHMLSTAAFNALLKTLEEPPEHVVFILATTDPQRVLPTIISRCQRFDFRRIPLEPMVQHLSAIAAKEAIDLTPDAIQLVGQISQGGLRDAESLLDQLSLLEGPVTVDRVWDLVGAVPERDLLTLVQAIAQDDPTTVLDQARRLLDRGREPLIVLQNLASFYRDLLIAKTSPDRRDLVAITPPTWDAMSQFVQSLDLATILHGQQHLRSSEVQVKNTTQPRLWLEVTLLGLLPSALTLSRPDATLQPTVRPVAPAAPSQNLTNGKTASAPKAPDLAPTLPPQPTPTVPPRSSPPLAEDSPPFPAKVSPPEIPVEAPIAGPVEVAVEPAAAVDLQQMWQEMLSVLQPPGTQALFKQQGRLLGFHGQQARVGITSQPLFKMAQTRITNVEAAFSKLCQQPVRVTLEVVAAEETPLPLSEPPPRPVARDPAASSSGFEPPEPPPTPTASAAPGVAQNPHPNADLVASPPEPVAEWQDEDDVHRAAKSLAQMFNGQIVSCDSDLPSLPIVAATDATLEAVPDEPTDGDPDDDVPF
ncbi:MAG: DNA polymerase III subunit gamma/tau [Synechococcales cyanobacterium M58_A2018_015]|nr:DNA polymerase III subunit gamma/tau [Synechococcales cyanobacterium M58_A2018_015]